LFDRPVDKTDRPLWKNSGCIGTEIFGLQALKAGQVLLYRQDLARATEKNDAAQKALLNGAGPGLDEAWRGVVSLGDGRVMLMTSCKMNKRDDLMRGFIWTPGARDFNTVILPGAMQSVQPLSENLWSVGEDLFTAADWAHAAALDKQIRTLKCRSITNESFAVDGFLDEWKDEEFVAIPQGRLAIRRPAIGSSFFRMAVDLTNQTAAAAVAASSDLRSACRVWVGRGEAASFEVQRAQVPLLANEAVIGPPAPTVRCCAWQVTPDARHVTMEFEFCPLGMTLRKPGVAPTEQSLRLGDLAIRITLDDPLIGSVDLVGNSHLAALGFVRLLLL